MRHGSSNRRQRNNNNRSGRRGGSPNRSQVFDSNGPEVRIRGTAHQVAEKYETLAKDAVSSGDYILAESYLQHAEHYLRIISSWDEQAEANKQQKQQQQQSNSDNQEQNSSGSQNSSRKTRDKNTQQSAGQNDDLGLPSSILNAGKDQKLEDV